MGSNSNYTDGLRVKIGENYKPPRKINLPMTYAQRLNFNKSLLEHLPNYEFGLERSVAGKMREWRNFRQGAQNARRERLKNLKEALGSKSTEEVSGETSSTSQSAILKPTQASSSSILQPIPLQNAAEMQKTQKSPFNIADFENDTSSPFDNMELQSMNDMEELARVLQDKKYEPEPEANYSNFAPAQYFPPPVQTQIQNGYYNNYCYYKPPTEYNAPATAVSNIATVADPFKNVPDVVRQLQDELQSIKVAETKKDKIKVFVEQQHSETDLVPDWDSLPKNLQDMCRSISLMGFPLGRVVRICQLLEGDHKKIVDHLLVLSELLDLGFQEQAISQALLQCNNDKEKALDLLIS